jgi:hypothetical protein
MEPVTTLALAGISWIVATATGGIAEGLADRTFVNTVRAIRERLPALAKRSEGGDLARGLLQAQMRALEQAILDYREELPLARFGGGANAFTERALEFCRSTAARPVPIRPLQGDELLLLGPLHAKMDSAAAGAAAIEGAVLAELTKALDGIPVPSGFAGHLRNGGRGTPRLVELFAICFTEQAKTDVAFREVLHTGLLLQNAANLAGLRDWLTQAALHFGGSLTRLERGVAAMTTENRAGFAAVLEALAVQKGVPAPPLRAILERFGEAAVPDEDILPRLSLKADEFLALTQQLSRPGANAVLLEGQKLLNSGDLDGARRLFADARPDIRSTREQNARDEAALLAAEAGVDRLQLRYREAANRYEEAERLVASIDPDAHFDYLCRRAVTLQHQGDEFGDNAVLFEVISLWTHAAQLRPRQIVPL